MSVAKNETPAAADPAPVPAPTVPPAVPKKKGLADILCVLLFLIGVGLWLGFASVVKMALGETFAGRADGLGMGLLAVFIGGVSAFILICAIVLALLATNLSRGFRVISLLPALAGLLTAVAIFVTLLVQGK